MDLEPCFKMFLHNTDCFTMQVLSIYVCTNLAYIVADNVKLVYKSITTHIS
jgi:hypothetical protein